MQSIIYTTGQGSLGASVNPDTATSQSEQDAGSSVQSGPLGAGTFKVSKGDCLSSIAYEHGHFWETIWNHPDNADLKQMREIPNVLLEGDLVTIPPIERKQLSQASDERHRFRMKGVPARLRMTFLVLGDPRAGDTFILTIDGRTQRGCLDGSGRIDIPIPPNAQKASFTLGDDAAMYDFFLGTLDPISEITGVQQRLTNLGYSCGEVDGIWGPLTKGAIREFQGDYNLTASGALNAATKRKLQEMHGS
jgi:hypothetical protein